MVDVGGDDGTSGCYFLAYEFRSDVALDAEGFGIIVLADGYIFHLRGDDTLAGKRHLGYFPAFGRAAGCVAVAEAD